MGRLFIGSGSKTEHPPLRNRTAVQRLSLIAILPVMNALDTSHSESLAASRDASQRFTAVRLPVEKPVEDVEDAVKKLKTCTSTELRRARQHHRRAIESLQDGGYSALPEDTRDDLLSHLRRNLEALNRALDARSSSSHSSSTASETTKDADTFFDHVRAFFRRLW